MALEKKIVILGGPTSARQMRISYGLAFSNVEVIDVKCQKQAKTITPQMQQLIDWGMIKNPELDNPQDYLARFIEKPGFVIDSELDELLNDNDISVIWVDPRYSKDEFDMIERKAQKLQISFGGYLCFDKSSSKYEQIDMKLSEIFNPTQITKASGKKTRKAKRIARQTLEFLGVNEILCLEAPKAVELSLVA